jgi:MarR-like DNA-binding transcriptional regulator SgrR of sgrS sRNA
MTEHRATKIALTAILIAQDKGEFRLPDLKERLHFPENPPSNSTIRQVLRQLEESGWLEREHPEGRIWYAGEQLEELF